MKRVAPPSASRAGPAVRGVARKRATLHEVAAKAGVSIATASVAISGRTSGNCRVSPAVAERVRRAARLLQYRPNHQARSLSSRRTRTVAMLVKRSSWHNAMFFLSAAQRVLRQHGYTEIFLMHADDKLASEREHIEMCLERRVEGILIIPLIDRDGRTNAGLLNDLQRNEGIAVVQLGLSIPECTAPAVTADETAGFASAVRVLHDAGHRRIALATLKGYHDPSPLNPYRHAHVRYIGYRQAVRSLGLDEQVLRPSRLARTVEMEFDAAALLGRQFRSIRPAPTAVLAYSDYTATGLVAGLADAGVAVPDDVSVLGYDNLPFASIVRPALGTIIPPYADMGRCATEMLLSAIDHGGPRRADLTLPPEIALRQSVRSLK